MRLKGSVSLWRAVGEEAEVVEDSRIDESASGEEAGVDEDEAEALVGGVNATGLEAVWKWKGEHVKNLEFAENIFFFRQKNHEPSM